MLIQIVDKNAEQALIGQLEELHGKAMNRNVLHCKFSMADILPKPSGLLKLFKNELADKEATIFFCDDGDVFVLWAGKASETISAIQTLTFNRLSNKLIGQNQETFFKHYDFHVHGENLRLLCRKRVNLANPDTEKGQNETTDSVLDFSDTNKPRPTPLKFSSKQLETFAYVQQKRLRRETLEVLIVEDQLFSSRLLETALEKEQICHTTPDAVGALALYSLHAPDIVFLDIELPDGSGHGLAKQFHDIDPDSYIIMVTANNHARDVNIARKNQVKGYIIKPFTLDKIYKCLDKFKTHHQRRKHNG